MPFRSCQFPKVAALPSRFLRFSACKSTTSPETSPSGACASYGRSFPRSKRYACRNSRRPATDDYWSRPCLQRTQDTGNLRAILRNGETGDRTLPSETGRRTRQVFSGSFRGTNPCGHTTHWGYVSQGDTHIAQFKPLGIHLSAPDNQAVAVASTTMPQPNVATASAAQNSPILYP